MIKRIVAILAVAVLSAACSSSNNNEDTTTTTTNRTVSTLPTTTTTSVDMAAVQCYTDVSDMITASEMIVAKTEVLSVNPTIAGVRQLVRDTKVYIAESRSVLARCSRYAPAEAAAVESTIDELEDNNNELERLVSQYS